MVYCEPNITSQQRPQIFFGRFFIEQRYISTTTTCQCRPPFWGLTFLIYRIKVLLTKDHLSTTVRGQFHQHSTSSFYVRKLRAQLFCAYVLGLYFTGVSLPAQKLLVECWWNWAQISGVPTVGVVAFRFDSTFVQKLQQGVFYQNDCILVNDSNIKQEKITTIPNVKIGFRIWRNCIAFITFSDEKNHCLSSR